MSGAIGQGDSLVALLFIDLVVVLALGALLGALARRVHQPAVVGEIIAGFALGPSLLGLLPGNLTAVLFMFLVGYEIDLGKLGGTGRAVAVVSAVSIVLPFCLGVGMLAVLRRGGAAWLPLALFIGAALSITAFPVLARILAERQMLGTRIGALSLACAAVNDAVAWCVLAVVAGVATAGSPWAVGVTLISSVGLFAAMVFVVRPLLRGPSPGWTGRRGRSRSCSC